MLQLIYKVLKNPVDATRISLLFANHSERDILLREELQALSVRHGGRLRLAFAVVEEPLSTTTATPFDDDSPNGTKKNKQTGHCDHKEQQQEHQLWPLVTGHVNAAMIAEHLPNLRDPSVAVFMCGRPDWVNEMLVPALDELGFPTNKRFIF